MTQESIERTLGNIESKLDQALKSNDVLFEKLGKLDERTDAVERWQAKVTHWGSGALAVMGLVWMATKFVWAEFLRG